MKLFPSMVVGVLAMTLAACGEPKPKPELQLQDIQGQTVSLQALRGQPLVVNAWASWCAPCLREMPLLQQAQQQHPEVVFVLVNQGETGDKVTAFLQQHRWQFAHVWLDGRYQLRQALPYQGLPSTYFLNRQGEVVAHSVGELNAEQLQQYLQQIL